MSKQTKILILAMVTLTGIGIFIAWIYYGNVNSAEDPQVERARKLLVEYDRVMQEGRYEDGFHLLDSAEMIYASLPCYAGSFELGVICNDRGSAILSMALYRTSDSLQKAELLYSAGKEIRRAISIYEQWLLRFDSLSPAEIRNHVNGCFAEEFKILSKSRIRRIAEKRTEDIELAKVETRRRLSVSYSNLGIIQRHQFLQDSAILSYMTALRLWKRNPTAKNNLNTLLGRPADDPSILEGLFPPDRKKPD